MTSDRKGGYTVLIASHPDYKNVVAEIYLDGLFLAQLNKEKGDEEIEIELADTDLDQKLVGRTADLKGFLAALEIARERLIGKPPQDALLS